MNDLTKYCNCGCGQKIETKRHHKYYGIPNYISGHNLFGKPKPKINKVCPICNKEFAVPPSLSKRIFCSRNCAKDHIWKLKIPTKDELERLYNIEKMPLYKIAKKFGLSTTPIYRWFKYYNISIKRGFGRTMNVYQNYIPNKLIENKANDFEIGYICGLIDGEGCIGLYKQKNKGYVVLRPRISIYNTNHEVIYYAVSILGGKVEYAKKQSPERDIYLLRLSNTKLLMEILFRIKDKLIIKKQQAELLFEFCQSRLNGAMERGIGYTEREMQIYDKIKILNKRGK